MSKRYQYEYRHYIMIGVLLCVVLLYLARLFVLQVLDDSYKARAEANSFFNKTEYPARGLIYDRKGRLMVYNQPAYDVMMVPREMGVFDTTDFCRTLHITRLQYNERMANMRNKLLNPGYSPYTFQLFLSQLTASDFGRLQEKLYKYPGVYLRSRIIRQHVRSIAANVVGNIREVSPKEIERDPYYVRGDYTGDLGVERSYEKHLRGVKGREILLRDAYGRIKANYRDGALDVAAVAGRDLTLSIDADLQEYGEQLMRNKIGAIVAIEPHTGEVLALVSSPTYDPMLLIGRTRGGNYMALTRVSTKPLLDRSIQGVYPPGSTYKVTQGLIFLQEGVIDSTTTIYPCTGGYVSGGLRVGCHPHAAPLPLLPAIQTSCNAFFCHGFRTMIDSRSRYKSAADALEVWKDHIVSMGYGYRLGIDIPGESRGFIPNVAFYDKAYGAKRWSGNTIISISIGQGEVAATPLQVANLAATVANKGYFYTPHIVKGIKDTLIDNTYTQPRYTSVDTKYYAPIIRGMRMAVTGGTCRIGAIPGIEVCGKTGTAQNPHGRDHSAFMGFAPMNQAKIAIAVYVENAGFGATYAVPIGSLMMEKYLKGDISSERKYLEERMLDANTMIFSGYTGH